MAKSPTPRDVAEHALDGELKPGASDALLSQEGFCCQFLGLDGEGRAVYYYSDDGTIVRYTLSGNDMERDETSQIGPSMSPGSHATDPYATAFTYLYTRERDWKWIHPRFRWIADELKDMDLNDGQIH